MNETYGAENDLREYDLVWEIAVRLCLLSDTHIGAAHSAPRHAMETGADLKNVDRDPGTGVPRLRATTLAGLLRHELLDRTADPDRVRALLGSTAPRTALGQQVPAPVTSALDIDDARAELPPDTGVAVRVGTRVDPATGTVQPGRVWQWEILPAGTVFTAHLRLRIPTLADEAGLLDLLSVAVGGLEGLGPGSHVGGRTGRGYGAVRATRWSAHRHDLTREDGWFAYHARTWDRRWYEGADALTDAPRALVRTLAEQLRAHGRTAAAARLGDGADHQDRRHRAELRMTLAVGERPRCPEPPRESGEAVPGPGATTGAGPVVELRPGLLMVGDTPAGERLGEVDRAHRNRLVVADSDDPVFDTEEPEVRLAPVLGDTALFALFKRIGGRLARDTAEHLAGGQDPNERWRDWHGFWWGADTDRRGAAPSPSRIRLRATPPVTGGAPLTTTRLTVDSLFGDAVDGRLFTTDLHCGGSAEVVLDIREPDDAVRGLLALLVRELATVAFDTVGSGAGGGNGRLTAVRAVLFTLPGNGREPWTVDLLAAARDPEAPEAAAARGWLAALHTMLAPGSGSAGRGDSALQDGEPW